MVNSRRVRATATSSNSVGNLRFETYKNLLSQINDAHKKHFYLESITLCESIISDRLEHRLNHLRNIGLITNRRNYDFSFSNLGDLIDDMERCMNSPHPYPQSLLTDLMPDLRTWKNSRNMCLHEMAKIEQNNAMTWSDKVSRAKQVSIEGISIMKKIKSTVDKIVKIEKNQNANP